MFLSSRPSNRQSSFIIEIEDEKTLLIFLKNYKLYYTLIILTILYSLIKLFQIFIYVLVIHLFIKF